MMEKKIISERAHLMCPNMFFGMMIKIDRQFSTQKFEESLQAIQHAHPLITACINKKDREHLCYQRRANYEIPWYMEKERAWEQIFQDISLKGWDARKESLLKVYVFQKEASFEVLLVVHHILCDGRGLLYLAKELADYYVHGITPAFVEEKLLESIEDLPSGSALPFFSSYLIKDVNKHWKQEKQKVSYDDYLEFEKDFASQNPVNRSMRNASENNLSEMIDICKANGISINDYLVAKMMKEEKTNKVIVAADIRGKMKDYQQGSLGNYATAYSVIIKNPAKDLLTLARQIRKKVQRIQKHPSQEMLVLACYFAMEPTLIDAVAISSLGKYDSRAGKFAGDKMFGYGSRNWHSITNLGKLESDSISEGFFIPPASPAARKTWGVLTVNGNMKIVESAYTH